MSIWVWLSIAATVVVLFLIIRTSRQRSRDRAVLEEFRRWSTSHSESEQPKKTGLAALSEREDQIRRASTSADNPICPSCRTIYNRAEVIRLIKLQSPELFEFQNWTTKFVCKVCPTEIAISGVRGE